MAKKFNIFGRAQTQSLPGFQQVFATFRQMLARNNRILEMFGELEDKTSGEYIFDINYLRKISDDLSEEVINQITDLNIFCDNKYPELYDVQKRIQAQLSQVLNQKGCQWEEWRTIPLDFIDRDCEEYVGGKTAKLGEIRNHVRLRTPDGFVLSTYAYQDYINHNHLFEKLLLVLKENRGTKEGEKPESGMLDEWFLRTKLPHHLRKGIRQELRRISREKKKPLFWAVRSSSVAEDVQFRSRAGQFCTILNIPEDQVFSAYKKIIASNFDDLPGVGEMEVEKLKQRAPMAVSVQEMIPAKVSGIAYSNDPVNPGNNTILISAVYGLGLPLVSGEMSGDIYRVSRINLTDAMERRVVEKKQMLVCNPEGGVEMIPTPEEWQKKPCLSDDQVGKIAEIAFILERTFKRPQDIEWAIDDQDQIVILQSRPLLLKARAAKAVKMDRDAMGRYQVILRNRGVVANRGIAMGKVCRVSEDFDPVRFPFGAIAVSRMASPKLGWVVRKASAIITDVGSSTSHLATIARELGVPAILGTRIASDILVDGMEITVDAQENVIYQGVIKELLQYEMMDEDVYLEMPEYKIIRRMLKILAPLNLTNPNSNVFNAKRCQTYHDIIRFCHEKAIQELINLNISSRRFPEVSLKKLKLTIPIGLKVIDIGNGVRRGEGEDGIITIEDVLSIPMKPLLLGLTAPNTWSTEPVDLRFGDFISSITRFTAPDEKLDYQGINLAVISDHYMNLSLRLGYHFNVIDAYVSNHVNDNYVFFRFVGGVTEDERRHRRALVIRSILEAEDFVVTVQGDLVTARVSQKSRKELESTLEIIGRLIGFTRQLDAKMNSEEAISHYTASFYKQNGLKSAGLWKDG